MTEVVPTVLHRHYVNLSQLRLQTWSTAGVCYELLLSVVVMLDHCFCSLWSGVWHGWGLKY